MVLSQVLPYMRLSMQKRLQKDLCGLTKIEVLQERSAEVVTGRNKELDFILEVIPYLFLSLYNKEMDIFIKAMYKQTTLKVLNPS